MKGLVCSILVFGAMLAFVIPANSQEVNCGRLFAFGQQCSGPNNCNQYVALTYPGFSSYSYELEVTYMWCCNSQLMDYNEGGYCSDPFGVINHDVLEFAMTHTVWLADCAGRFRPYARSWTAPSKPIDLKSKLVLN